LTVDRKLCAERLSTILDHPIDGDIQFDPTTDQSSATFNFLTLSMDALLDKTNQDFLVRSPVAAQRMQEHLIDLMLLGWHHNYFHKFETQPKMTAPRQVRRAIDAIEANPQYLFTVPELAKISGVSVRSLQYGFKRHMGIGVVEYMRNVRLEGARREIVTNRHETIDSIAKRWGFLNTGRFSGYFKQAFGKHPSQLKRM
jgi:transcriptional regulator GlxA family with amidase domain